MLISIRVACWKKLGRVEIMNNKFYRNMKLVNVATVETCKIQEGRHHKGLQRAKMRE